MVLKCSLTSSVGLWKMSNNLWICSGLMFLNGSSARSAPTAPASRNSKTSETLRFLHLRNENLSSAPYRKTKEKFRTKKVAKNANFVPENWRIRSFQRTLTRFQATPIYAYGKLLMILLQNGHFNWVPDVGK